VPSIEDAFGDVRDSRSRTSVLAEEAVLAA